MTVAPAPSVSAGPAAHTDRILRLFARFISVGYLGYLLLLSGAISTLAPRMQTWWTAAAVVVVFGTGLLPAAASFRPDTRAIRHGAGVAAVAFLLATALWPVAWVGPELPGDDGIWLAAFPGLDGLAAVIAWSTAVAFGYLVVACVGVELANAAARGDFGAGLLIPQIAFAIMFCSIFVGGAAMALRTGRVLDATTAQTHAAAAAAATQAARAAERERFDALIHDGVMATLLAAARGQSPADTAHLAATTVHSLDALRAGGGADGPFTADAALVHLRSSALGADPHTRFVVEHTDPAPEATDLPAESVRRLGAALAEAVRNSRLHAGQDAHRTVTVSVDRAGITVRVVDDGTGFDPAAVPAHRLGITVSILGRMRQIDGGSARIDSAPGQGTVVVLDWRIR